MILSISGPVARLDQPSVDGRQLSREGMTLPDRPLPLLALHAGVNPRLGSYGAEPVGTLGAWDLIQDGEQFMLEVCGDVYDDQRIPVGKYACGLDARFEPGDVEYHPDERWPETGLMIVRRWAPLAVTLLLPGSVGTAPWELPPLVVAAP